MKSVPANEHRMLLAEKGLFFYETFYTNLMGIIKQNAEQRHRTEKEGTENIIN